MLDQWMESLTKEMKLNQALPKDPNGTYLLPLEEGVSVSISPLSEGCSFYSTPCSCPAQKLEEFYTQAMLANLFGQGTKGAVLGLTDDYKQLTLSKELLKAYEYREFRDTLEDFLNSIDFWIEEAKNPS